MAEAIASGRHVTNEPNEQKLPENKPSFCQKRLRVMPESEK